MPRTRTRTQSRPARPGGRAAAKLLRWYDEHRRDLPWRRQRDPYAILVSEVMLQQTRAETVLEYYEAFLERFPTLQVLAQASVEEVLAAWSGLGYYQRARRLHRAAQQIVDGDGEIPASLEGLRSLPGIGAYTAAAVGSIAFGIAEPVVDGNVERVVSRHGAIGGDPRRGEVRKRIENGARALLDLQRPGDSNQALMELGATVCRPRKPRCRECPLRDSCQALRKGEAEGYPEPRARSGSVRVRRQVAVVQKGGRILLFRRPDDSPLLAGMWELPWIDVDEDLPAGRSFADRYGGRWRIGDHWGKVRHSITYRSFDIEVSSARLDAGDQLAEGPEAGWFELHQLDRLPMTSLVRKVLLKLESSSQSS